MPFLKQVNQVHLSDNNHPLLISVQAFDQVIVIPVVYIQPLIARDDTYFGKRLHRKLEQRFGYRNINMYRTFSMMVGFQQGFIHQAVTVPFILFCLNLRKVYRLLDQCLKNTGLRQCLSRHLSNPGSRPIGRDNN